MNAIDQVHANHDTHMPSTPRSCEGGCGKNTTPFRHTTSAGLVVNAWPHDPCDECAELGRGADETSLASTRLKRIGIPTKLREYCWLNAVAQDGASDEQFMEEVMHMEAQPVGVLACNRAALRHFARWNPRTAPNQWWFIEGSVGTGKSLYAAATVMRHVGVTPLTDITPSTWVPGEAKTYSAPSSFDAKFISEDELMERVKQGWKLDAAVLSKFAKTQLLVIDEFAPKKKLPDFWRDNMERIVRYRYDHSLPIVFTSNVQMADIEDLYSARMYDRIIERVGRDGHVILGGPSWRRF